MRIGLVAYWFNRGQGVVARQLRSALDDLGHETYVLARPTRKTNIRPDWIDASGVWAQERVTAASDYAIPSESTRPGPTTAVSSSSSSIRTTSSTEIAGLRESGVRTAGRFVWEHFAMSTSSLPGGLRRDLLADGMRAQRYAGWASRAPACASAATPTCSAAAARGAGPGRRRQRLAALPGRIHEQAQAARRGDRGVPRRRRRRAAADPEGAGRPAADRGSATGPRRPADRPQRPADRDRQRRPADGGVHGDVRGGVRDRRAEPLGGARPAPLRGDGARHPDHDQRQSPDERDRDRRAQRPARAGHRRRHGPLGNHRLPP